MIAQDLPQALVELPQLFSFWRGERQRPVPGARWRLDGKLPDKLYTLY
ncbi:MAG: hypothetical protein ABC550_02230 [Candidatus Methanosuratincola petrocarbonis]